LHGTGISGNIPAEICGNCFFGVMTLHNIPAFAGDNDTQVAKRRTFRRDCSRAKTEAYATCVREYRKFDITDRNEFAPFMMTRITDADGTWDCGGNLSVTVSGFTPGAYKRGAEYDGCVFLPLNLSAKLLPPYHSSNSTGVNSMSSRSFWISSSDATKERYYYPMLPQL
jgi:hypothetical protein